MKTKDLNNYNLLFNEITTEGMKEAGIFLCLSGTADVVINNKFFRLKRGTVHVISPLVRALSISKSQDFDGVYILDKLEVLYPLMRMNMDTIVSLKLRIYPCIQLQEDDIAMLLKRKRLIAQKENAMVVAESDNEKRLLLQMKNLITQETLLEILNIYFRDRIVEPEPIGKDETLIYNFLYSINRNYKRSRSVKFYADEANLSTGRFTAIVKQTTGMPPSDWLTTITIINAKIMLEKTNKRIKEIAEELNFPEQFTFRKYFKHHTGISPKQYRATCRTQQSQPSPVE